ncbi:MAG: hypothetical protein MZV63_33905 [Marinilabiliales bacterium]|nr:hypothetical protein [Marinilabiliales bacterium]
MVTATKDVRRFRHRRRLCLTPHMEEDHDMTKVSIVKVAGRDRERDRGRRAARGRDGGRPRRSDPAGDAGDDRAQLGRAAALGGVRRLHRVRWCARQSRMSSESWAPRPSSPESSARGADTEAAYRIMGYDASSAAWATTWST